MRVAIIGSRNCQDFTIDRMLKHLPENCSQIISGGATGVDTLAKEAAKLLDIPFLCYEPDYELHGKSAPIVRNSRIIEKADLVLAFWDFSSRGTANTIAQCIEKRVPVRVIGLDE